MKGFWAGTNVARAGVEASERREAGRWDVPRRRSFRVWCAGGSRALGRFVWFERDCEEVLALCTVTSVFEIVYWPER